MLQMNLPIAISNISDNRSVLCRGDFLIVHHLTPSEMRVCREQLVRSPPLCKVEIDSDNASRRQATALRSYFRYRVGAAVRSVKCAPRCETHLLPSMDPCYVSKYCPIEARRYLPTCKQDDQDDEAPGHTYCPVEARPYLPRCACDEATGDDDGEFEDGGVENGSGACR